MTREPTDRIEAYWRETVRLDAQNAELRAEVERLKAAIAWTREVRPGKNPKSGGAIVHMTWDQFNAMRAALEPKP